MFSSENPARPQGALDLARLGSLFQARDKRRKRGIAGGEQAAPRLGLLVGGVAVDARLRPRFEELTPKTARALDLAAGLAEGAEVVEA